jgi:hypothetical protein
MQTNRVCAVPHNNATISPWCDRNQQVWTCFADLGEADSAAAARRGARDCVNDAIQASELDWSPVTENLSWSTSLRASFPRELLGTEPAWGFMQTLVVVVVVVGGGGGGVCDTSNAAH